MEQIDPRHLLKKISQILEDLGISYFITGGMAVLIWGRPRFTADIDILVELDSKNVSRLERALLSLGKAGYVDKDAIEEALLKEGEFNFIDGETGDGTIISISYITKKPILYLGTGQRYEDIELFNKEKFIKNLGL